jgi:hypothetical protein
VSKNVKAIENILALHADALARGQHTLPTLPVDTDTELLNLLSLAEFINETLVPVRPDPGFVRRLGKGLLSTARQGRKTLTLRARRAAVVGAAMLGSLVSVASAVGLIVYMIKHRVRV